MIQLSFEITGVCWATRKSIAAYEIFRDCSGLRPRYPETRPSSVNFRGFSPEILANPLLYSSAVTLPDEDTAMRIDKKTIEKITHRKRTSAQVAWFQEKLGADVPFDRFGPILTEDTLRKLIEKRLGILELPSEPSGKRPAVRLLKELKS